MLRLLERKRRQQTSCRHDETAVTSNFGLLRIVCLDCGNVDLADLERQIVARDREIARIDELHGIARRAGVRG